MVEIENRQRKNNICIIGVLKQAKIMEQNAYWYQKSSKKNLYQYI